jgi:hypothetical protein
MSKYRDDFLRSSRFIRELLNLPNTQKFPDKWSQARADSLRSIFSGSQEDIVSFLDTVADSAPMTFEAQWKIVESALPGYANDSERALHLLARLAGWALMERIWIQDTTPAMPALVTLAGLVLGLDPQTPEFDVRNAVFMYRGLLQPFMLKRMETIVVGGMVKIENTEKAVEQKIADWQAKLDAAQKQVAETEGRINAYEASIQKYRIAFGFLGLAAAFREFFMRKRLERAVLLTVLCLLAVLIVAVPFVVPRFLNQVSQISLVPTAYAQSASPRTAQPAARGPEMAKENRSAPPASTAQNESPTWAMRWTQQAAHYLPVAVLEVLLIWFFRIVLVHFNSAQVQMMQLELRMAACGFIDEYVKFLNTSGKPDLSKFESLIFGGIVADHDKVPSTFDGLEQLVKSFKEIKA